MKKFTIALIILAGFTAFSAAQAPGFEPFRQEGIASWYGWEFDGRPTASGEIFNSALFTAAHPTLPFGTFLIVTNLQNNLQVVVRVNDRGPFVVDRIIDLSIAAANAIGVLATGTAPVIIEQTTVTTLGPVVAPPLAQHTPAPHFAPPPVVHTPAPHFAPPMVAAPPPHFAPAAAHAPAPHFVPPPVTAPPPALHNMPPAPIPHLAQPPAAAPTLTPHFVPLPPEAAPTPHFAPPPVAHTPAPHFAPPVAAAPVPHFAPPPATHAPVPHFAPEPPVAAPVPQPAPQAVVVVPPPIAAISAPPAQLLGTVPEPGSTNLYRIQVGSYLVPRHAVESFERLRNSGLRPAYERSGSFYRVVLPGIRADEMMEIAQTLGNVGVREVIVRMETGN